MTQAVSSPYVPPIGARVRMVESDKTSNWTRIDLGRFGRVTAHKAFSFRLEHGPRVLVILDFETNEKWDGGGGSRGIHASPCQVEIVGEGEAAA